jgi:hypothetical protein
MKLLLFLLAGAGFLMTMANGIIAAYDQGGATLALAASGCCVVTFLALAAALDSRR